MISDLNMPPATLVAIFEQHDKAALKLLKWALWHWADWVTNQGGPWDLNKLDKADIEGIKPIFEKIEEALVEVRTRARFPCQLLDETGHFALELYNRMVASYKHACDAEAVDRERMHLAQKEQQRQQYQPQLDHTQQAQVHTQTAAPPPAFVFAQVQPTLPAHLRVQTGPAQHSNSFTAPSQTQAAHAAPQLSPVAKFASADHNQQAQDPTQTAAPPTAFVLQSDLQTSAFAFSGLVGNRERNGGGRHPRRRGAVQGRATSQLAAQSPVQTSVQPAAQVVADPTPAPEQEDSEYMTKALQWWTKQDIELKDDREPLKSISGDDSRLKAISLINAWTGENRSIVNKWEDLVTVGEQDVSPVYDAVLSKDDLELSLKQIHQSHRQINKYFLCRVGSNQYKWDKSKYTKQELNQSGVIHDIRKTAELLKHLPKALNNTFSSAITAASIAATLTLEKVQEFCPKTKASTSEEDLSTTRRNPASQMNEDGETNSGGSSPLTEFSSGSSTHAEEDQNDAPAAPNYKAIEKSGFPDGVVPPKASGVASFSSSNTMK